MINFFPIEEVKKFFQVILKALEFELGYKNTTAWAKTMSIKAFYRKKNRILNNCCVIQFRSAVL